MGPDPDVEAGSKRPPIVSVVIVTFATGRVVLDALSALRAHTPVAHEIIVVDNPPPDGRQRTADLIAESGGDDLGMVVIRADENLGFGGGCNLGARTARGEFLCFLNPDAIVGPGWLEPLLAALDDPVVGIAAPVLADPDGSLQEAGQLLYDDACTAAIGGPEVMSGDWNQAFTRDVDYASAACWVVRRTEFLDLGGFDERYQPAFFEDVDYALRVEARGQRTRLVADVPVVHLHGEGGAGGDLAMGQASQAVFRSIWADRLTRQPPRPVDDVDALVNRDRLAAEVHGWIVRGDDVADQRRALKSAADLARSHPRQRVSVLVDEALLAEDEARAARAAGVEVVVGDAEGALAARSRPASTWGQLGLPSGPGLRDAVRSLWSPWTIVVALVGVVVRALVMRSAVGELNADEAYTGLASMELLDGRFPVVIDGNVYSATLEAYLFAPVTAVAGPNVVLLKCIPVVFWAIAAGLVYVAGVVLGGALRGGGDPGAAGRRVGAVAGSAVWIAPGALLVISTRAYLGYALGMAVCVALLLAARSLVDRASPGWRVAASFGGLGGLAFYIHPMFVTVVIPIAMVVAIVHRRAVRTVWLPAIGAAIVVCGPFIAWNAVNGFPSVVDVPPAMTSTTYAERLELFFTELLPRGLGLRDPAFEWLLGRPVGLLVYAVLLVAIAAGCVVSVTRARTTSRWLLPSVLIGVWPLMALLSALGFTADGRYAIIAFPFLVLAMSMTLAVIPVVGRTSSAIAVAAVVAWTALLVWPHTARVTSGGAVDANAPTHEVVDFLQAEGIDMIAGNYWRILPIEYLSDREIHGAVTSPPVIRFPERQREVQSAPSDTVAFVFLRGEAPSGLWMPIERYRHVTVGESEIYLPRPAD